METKNPAKSRKIRESCFGGELYPASILVGVFCFFFEFLRNDQKRFNNPGDEINKGGRVDPYSEMLGKLMTCRGSLCHQSKIATFEDESINSNSSLWHLFCGQFSWKLSLDAKKNFMSNLFWGNKHVISWFVKIPVPFSKAFFTSNFEKTFFRSPWASGRLRRNYSTGLERIVIPNQLGVHNNQVELHTTMGTHVSFIFRGYNL